METLGPIGRAHYDISQLEKWMKDEEYEVDPASYGSAKAWVRREPKGVIGMLVSISSLLICYAESLVRNRSGALQLSNGLVVRPLVDTSTTTDN